MSDSFTSDERETTISATDGDDIVRIWTAQRSTITRLRRHRAFTETDSGYYGSSEWAAFTIPADQWWPDTGAKRYRRPMTEAEREAAAEHLARGRATQRGEAAESA